MGVSVVVWLFDRRDMNEHNQEHQHANEGQRNDGVDMRTFCGNQGDQREVNRELLGKGWYAVEHRLVQRDDAVFHVSR